MKQLLALFILALGLTCRAQEQTFTLRGTLRNAQPGHALILFDMTGGDFRIDTLRLTDGRFAYTGTCRGREQRTLMLADPVRQARERAKGKGKPTVLYGSFVAMVWFAAKIYRVGIFMYGKKPTLRELLRWVRYKS